MNKIKFTYDKFKTVKFGGPPRPPHSHATDYAHSQYLSETLHLFHIVYE